MSKLDENINVTRFSMKSVDEKLKFMKDNIDQYYKSITDGKVTINIKRKVSNKTIKAKVLPTDPVHMIKFHWLKKNTKDNDIWACFIYHGPGGNDKLVDTTKFEDVPGFRNSGIHFVIKTKEESEVEPVNKLLKRSKSMENAAKKLKRAVKIKGALKKLKDDNTIEIPEMVLKNT
tara:strand:- start:6027 stop:6551 length:525 start_codon:yes stop_codon:yes gene_type:complete